jgi:hypothetical protein
MDKKVFFERNKNEAQNAYQENRRMLQRKTAGFLVRITSRFRHLDFEVFERVSKLEGVFE